MSSGTTEKQSRRNPGNSLGTLGTVLLFTGAGFIFFLTIARSPESAIPLPRFLYRHRELWLVAGGGMVALGMLCLRGNSNGSTTPDSSPFRSVVLYTREECHLCDEAKAILDKYRSRLPGIDEVDIDEDNELVAEFGEWVPVVEIDGKVRFKGRIDEMLLRRLIDGTERAAQNGSTGNDRQGS
ncbi:MAG: glutaredoxin family protein [Planctomycetaceae bacterium]